MYFKKNITFFCTDKIEIHTIDGILCEAKIRGYETKITSNLLEKAEIGVYCQHVCFPKNSKLSIILLHDVAQGHNRWPNIWEAEPWDEFDIGILPGNTWEERWQECSWHPFTRPKLGVYKMGWPKADIIFKKQSTFKKETEDFRSQLNLKYERSILYAPSWENDGKQDQFVQSLKSMPVNLLLKQAPWTDAYPHIMDNIRIMNDLHKNYAPNVHIIEPNVSIMYCIGIADIIVSDESSVMLEGLFLDVPSIAVTDWKIPDCSPPRDPSIPFDFVCKTNINSLKIKVEDILFNIKKAKAEIKELKESNFVNLGTSSLNIMDLIDNVVQTNSINMKAVIPKHNLKQVDLLLKIRRQYRQMRSLLRISLNNFH